MPAKPSRARERALPPDKLPVDHPDYRPLGHDGKKHVRFARDDFSQERIDKLVAALEDGIAMDVAARVLGDSVTASQVRMYRRREPAFDELCGAAQEIGKLAYQDRLRMKSRSRATAESNPSDRMLEVELATHVPEYGHLRRDRMAISGKLDLEHSVVLRLDPAVLDTWPREKLLAFRQQIAELNAGLDGGAHELGPGD